MELTPFPSALICLPITLLCFWIGLLFMGLVVLPLSFVLQVRFSLALLLLWQIHRPKLPIVLLLKFLLNFDSILISDT